MKLRSAGIALRISPVKLMPMNASLTKLSTSAQIGLLAFETSAT
jgi:hypothetical protein